MTNPTPRKISELATLSSPAVGDFIPIVDVSDTSFNSSGETKKITYDTLKTDIQNAIDTGFTETDPIFAASIAAGITANEVGQWNAAYNWGNHAVQGYLQSISAQSIDVLNDVDTSTATTNDILRWNGNSWVADAETSGGTTINVLNDVGNVNISSVINGQVLTYDGASEKWINSAASGGGIQLSDLSVQQNNASGSGSLSYTAGEGKFTYTPPNLSSFSSSITVNGNLTTTGTISVDGAGNSKGKILLEDTGDIGQITFHDSNGNAQIALKGVTSNLYVEGGSGMIRLHTYSIFNHDGNVTLNNGGQGTTSIKSTLDVTNNVEAAGLKLDNNSSLPSSPAQREMKVIGNAPYFYDGTAWRPFFLIDNSGTNIPADTEWDNVMIRATFDSSFDDVKHNATPNRSSTTDTALVSSPVKIAGGKALRLDDAYIDWDVTDTSKYDFTGAWTMEAWVYIDEIVGVGSPDVIFSGNSASSFKNWGLKIVKPMGTGTIQFRWFNRNNDDHDDQLGTLIVDVNASQYEGAWHHVAYVKDATTGQQKLYLDGFASGTTITDNDILNPDEFALGYQEYYGEDFDGLIDDLRVSQSTRYTANFTPSTVQLPISGSTTQIPLPKIDKKLEIGLGSSPTIKGSSGVSVAQQSSGVYRLTFTPNPYSDSRDYYVIAQGMDHQSGATSYIKVTRDVGHVDITVKNQANDNAINTGYLGVQIINHV